MISVICPTYNEQAHIASCIESLICQTYPFKDLELIIADGRSTDDTRGIVSGYSEKYSNIRLIDNPGKTAPCGLNLAIKAAKGDIIVRIDAHSVYPADYVEVLTTKLKELGADNVGCVCRTIPAEKTSACMAIALAMSHPFGVGGSAFRITSKDEMAKPRKVDTVPFGCFRRDVFDRIGLFDEELVRNQDDEFNGRIIRNGGSIYLIPSISVDYYARKSFSKVWKMYFQYGLFKPAVMRKLGAPATIRQFFPAAFILGIVIGGVLSAFSPTVRLIYIAVLFLYALICVFFGIKSAKEENNISLVFLLPAAFVVLHISYGCGYILGSINLLLGRSVPIECSR